LRGDFQLFVHILGAVSLFGAVAAVAVMGLAARRVTEARPLAAGALVSTLFVAVPAWIVMYTFGFWTKSKRGWPDHLGWITLPMRIADAGLVVLLGMAGLSYVWLRRPERGRLPLALGVLSLLYILALGVAWWAMTAKVPA
jgi:uncharacterized membrane protein